MRNNTNIYTNNITTISSRQVHVRYPNDNDNDNALAKIADLKNLNQLNALAPHMPHTNFNHHWRGGDRIPQPVDSSESTRDHFSNSEIFPPLMSETILNLTESLSINRQHSVPLAPENSEYFSLPSILLQKIYKTDNNGKIIQTNETPLDEYIYKLKELLPINIKDFIETADDPYKKLPILLINLQITDGNENIIKINENIDNNKILAQLAAALIEKNKITIKHNTEPLTNELNILINYLNWEYKKHVTSYLKIVQPILQNIEPINGEDLPEDLPEELYNKINQAFVSIGIDINDHFPKPPNP